MALVAEYGGVWAGPPDWFSGGAASTVPTSVLLDAADDRIAFVFYAPKSGSIRKIAFLLGTVPALGGDSTLVYSLQDVDLATGNPDGTEDQTATIATGAIVAGTMVLSGNLSADRVVTRGDLLAMVVKFGTFNTGDQVNIQVMSRSTRQEMASTYVTSNLTGAYAKSSAQSGIGEVEYDDGTHAFVPALMPFDAFAADTIGTGSTPDEVGLRFQVPTPRRLAGAWINGEFDGDFAFKLYTASGVTTCMTVDKDVRCTTVAMTHRFIFATPVTLAANTTYVLAVAPTSATTLNLSYGTVRAAVALDGYYGGQAWHYAAAKDPSLSTDFTLTTTRRPMMGLFFDQFDDGASGPRGMRQVRSTERRRR